MTSLADQFDSIPTGQGASSAPAAPSNAPPDYSSILQTAGQKYNVDPKLLGAMLQTESSGKPGAVSNKGATGLMQIEPSNYKALGITDPTNPTQNIMGGAKLMSQLLDRYGDVPTALTHYVGGDDQSKWGPQTRAYPARVLSNYGAPQASGAQQQPQGSTAPQPARASSLADQFDATPTQSSAPAQPLGPGMPTKPQTPVTAAQNDSSWSDVAEKGVGNFASSLIGVAGAGARLVGANEFADKAQAARQQIEQKMAADTNNSISGKVAGVVGGALPYAAMGGASIPGAIAGGAAAGAIPTIAENGTGAQVVQNAAAGAGLGLAGGIAGKVIGTVVPAMAHLVGIGSRVEPEAAAAAAGSQAAGSQAAGAAGVSGRGSVGAAATPYAAQAAAEGAPDVMVQRIAAAERSGALNPTAAERHIEAATLPVPMELTEGMASGNPVTFSNEMNARGKNPDYAFRLNQLNSQIGENLTAIRDQVAPNVNVPSGTPTGQALVDAYKEMDGPIQDQISAQYARARNADGAPALVNAAPQMRDFAAQVGPTRFNALPANVQQIFRDAVGNQVTLPAGFEVNGSSVRPMNVSDLMDIDKTLSGAMRSATDGSVRHDIGALRDAIVNADLDPSAAGSDAFAAYRTAQASARARFQAMDADPAYKAAVNDITPAGEPSPLADQFAQKYIAGGKTAHVQNMMQNLSNDPANLELVRGALVDHLTQQAGLDLRTGAGNVSQARLNRAITGLGDKTRTVLGPQATQNIEKLGNVARYTQEQTRGSFVNNSNTTVAAVANAAKTAVEGAANVAAKGVPVGTWARKAIERRSDARELARTLEPGAGLTSVPLNRLVNRTRGNQ